MKPKKRKKFFRGIQDKLDRLKRLEKDFEKLAKENAWLLDRLAKGRDHIEELESEVCDLGHLTATNLDLLRGRDKFEAENVQLKTRVTELEPNGGGYLRRALSNRNTEVAMLRERITELEAADRDVKEEAPKPLDPKPRWEHPSGRSYSVRLVKGEWIVWFIWPRCATDAATGNSGMDETYPHRQDAIDALDKWIETQSDKAWRRTDE